MAQKSESQQKSEATTRTSTDLSLDDLENRKGETNQKDTKDPPNELNENQYYLSMISKAGMKDADAQKVHDTIIKHSKNSEYFKSEEQKLD